MILEDLIAVPEMEIGGACAVELHFGDRIQCHQVRGNTAFQDSQVFVCNAIFEISTT